MTFQFGPQPSLSPEEKVLYEKYVKEAGKVNLAERQQIVRWAPIFCSCSPWFVRGEGPPQPGCVVHSGFMLLPGGEWL